MTEDEGGPKPPADDRESDPASPTGDAAAKEDKARPRVSRDESAADDQAAIDLDSVHDRAS